MRLQEENRQPDLRASQERRAGRPVAQVHLGQRTSFLGIAENLSEFRFRSKFSGEAGTSLAVGQTVSVERSLLNLFLKF